MSFITSGTSVITEPINAPVDLQGPTTYYIGNPNVLTITNFDSFTTYTVSSPDGTIVQSGTSVTYTPNVSGSTTFIINGRTVNVTVSPVDNYLNYQLNVAGFFSLDSSNNIYFSANNRMLGKYNQYGGFVAGKNLSTLIPGTRPVIDSGGNIYIFGNVSSRGHIAKYNSSLVLQFQQRYGSGNSVVGAAVDSSDNVITVYDSGSTVTWTVKTDSTGAKLWARQLSIATQANPSGVAVDSTSSVIVCGTATTGTVNGFIVKYNSAGSLLWQRVTTTQLFNNAVCVDSSNNIYVAGNDGSGNLYIYSITSGGAIRWSRVVTGTSGTGLSNQFTSIAVDAAGFVYAIGLDAVAGGGTVLVRLVSSTGATSWTRKIDNSNPNGSIACAGNTDFVISKSNSSVLSYADFPSDGTKTGTYVLGSNTIIYSNAYSTSAGGLALTTGTLTDAAETSTFAASALTDQTLGAAVSTIFLVI